MTFLDRYILRQFFFNFAVLFGLLFVFTCMIDLFLNVDRFIEAVDAIVQGRDVSTWVRLRTTAAIVIDFYWPRIFQFYAFLLGIVSIGAIGFTLVQFHRHREMTATLASGVSLHRIVMPLILAAVGLNLLLITNRELVLPRIAPLLLRDHGSIGQETVDGFRVNLAADRDRFVFYARFYQPSEETLEELTVWEYEDSGELARIIRADSATWAENGWALTNGVAIPLTSSTTMTAEQPSPIDFLRSNLDPDGLLLRRHLEFRQMLSLRQIGEIIDRSTVGGLEDLMRMRFGRFAQILINLLTLLIVLPFFMLREPANLVTQIVWCSAGGLAAQIGGAVGVTVGVPLLPPAASVFFIPLVILLPLAVLRITRVQT